MISKLIKKTTTFVVSAAMVFSTITFTMPEKTVSASPTTGSKLVWSDEFNGNSIDTSKWGFEIGTGSNGWGNNEQQYYTNRSDKLMLLTVPYTLERRKSLMVEGIIHPQDLIQMENLHLHMAM